MFSCKECINYDTCTKPCEAIEETLKEQGIYKSDYIRPERSSKQRKDGKGRWKEVPFSALSRVDSDKNPYFDPNI